MSERLALENQGWFTFTCVFLWLHHGKADRKALTFVRQLQFTAVHSYPLGQWEFLQFVALDLSAFLTKFPWITCYWHRLSHKFFTVSLSKTDKKKKRQEKRKKRKKGIKGKNGKT